MSRSGSAVGRMCRAIITFGILAIDVLRLGEDQVTADGTLFKGEMSVTHLPPFSLGFFEEGMGKRGGNERREKADLCVVVGGGKGSSSVVWWGRGDWVGKGKL